MCAEAWSSQWASSTMLTDTAPFGDRHASLTSRIGDTKISTDTIV
jgi:hypothetical protein